MHHLLYFEIFFEGPLQEDPEEQIPGQSAKGILLNAICD